MVVFYVETWGTVGEMVGGVGTTAAALWAAATYSIDFTQKRSAQAKLVRAYVHPRPDGILELSVVNDSDRPVVLDMLAWRETSFGKALISGDHMRTKSQAEVGHDEKGEPILVNSVGGDSCQYPKFKSDIYGYRDNGGLLAIGAALQEDRRLLPGRTVRFTLSLPLAQYRPSYTYLLGFYDANGLGWERSLSDPNGQPAKPKRRKHWRNFHQAYREPGVGSWIRHNRLMAMKKARIYIHRRLWLFAHRKELTSPYPKNPADERWDGEFVHVIRDSSNSPGES